MSASPYAEHLARPRGRATLEGRVHRGAAGGSACGDVIAVSLGLEEGRVARAAFDARGCAALTAAGSAVVELVDGAPLLDAARLDPGAVTEALGGLSPVRRHAAVLAADAFHRALGAAAGAGDVRLPADPDRVLVAMSGGVDSALAAHLAREAGKEVVGVTLELWADVENDGERSCCSPQAVTGARALAHGMGLPHLTLDLREAFRREVVDDYVAEHAAGRTPNPCVRCNGRVRFAEMLELAARLGAARLATGHYARVGGDRDGPLLEPAADEGKDQAYVLARLAPGDLERLWFPLGEMPKTAVRDRARRAGLPVADRPDSQDLCFLAGVGRERFLDRRRAAPLPTAGPASASPAGGEIVALDGRVLGRHPGQERFTVGQRRGLGLAAPEPLFVIDKDATSDRVVVGPRAALAASGAVLSDVVLHRHGARVDRVKLRYRSAPVDCRVGVEATAGRHDRLELAFEAPAEAPAPGQTAVLMDGARVVGAGVVAAASREQSSAA